MSDPVRQPRSLTAATALAERYAVLDAQIAAIEAGRRDALAAVNARADTATVDLIDQRDRIEEKIEPWFMAAKAELTEGKRKSIELGGCMLGTRTGKATLVVAGKQEDVAAVMSGLRWAKPFLRVKTSIDAVATLKATDGKKADALAKLGISKRDGEESFYIQRVEQSGTIGAGS